MGAGGTSRIASPPGGSTVIQDTERGEVPNHVVGPNTPRKTPFGKTDKVFACVSAYEEG